MSEKLAPAGSPPGCLEAAPIALCSTPSIRVRHPTTSWQYRRDQSSRRGMRGDMTSAAAHVRIRCPGGELVRADVITWLRCGGEEVQAARSDGTMVRLAGPGCPPDFDIALLRELKSAGRFHNDQRVAIVTAEITASAARWVSAQLDELGPASGLGS
jgi:hypothetical protein